MAAIGILLKYPASAIGAIFNSPNILCQHVWSGMNHTISYHVLIIVDACWWWVVCLKVVFCPMATGGAAGFWAYRSIQAIPSFRVPKCANPWCLLLHGVPWMVNIKCIHSSFWENEPELDNFRENVEVEKLTNIVKKDPVFQSLLTSKRFNTRCKASWRKSSGKQDSRHMLLPPPLETVTRPKVNRGHVAGWSINPSHRQLH